MFISYINRPPKCYPQFPINTHLQALGRFEKHGQRTLTHVDLALVHEVEQRAHLCVSDIFQVDDGMWMLVL